MHILDTQPHRISPPAQLHSPPNTRPRSMGQHYTPTHASFYLCTDPERPTMMLVMRPCAQRNIACRRHCTHFGHPRPYLSPATPLHSPPNVPPRSWTSTTPTHASFYLCTAPEQPALMLVVRPCAQRNHVCRVHSSPRASAKHGAALPPPMLRSTFALPQSGLQ